MADRDDGASKGVTNDLTKEDEEGLANFLQNVQNQQLKNDMTMQAVNGAGGNGLLTIPNYNLNDFDSKSAADPSDFHMDKI